MTDRISIQIEDGKVRLVVDLTQPDFFTEDEFEAFLRKATGQWARHRRDSWVGFGGDAA